MSQRFRVDGDPGIFLKTLLMWTQKVFIGIKKMRFQKYPDACGRGLKPNLHPCIKRDLYAIRETWHKC